MPPPSSASSIRVDTAAPEGLRAAQQGADGHAAHRPELRLEVRAGRGWRRRAGELTLRGAELTLDQPGVLREPLTLAGGRVSVASIDFSAHDRSAEHGRFPVLQRLGANTVASFEHGIHGWLWTSRGGSALPTLADSADALPNLALIFVKPLDDEEVARCFEPEWVRALAARSPLGSPSVAGLLAPVTDARAAEDAFRRFGVLGPLSDREVPPTMRRHLPGDRPADPQVPVDERVRRRTSVAPPGLG